MKKILLKLAKNTENLVILTTNSSQFEYFSKFFPNKVFNFGLAESNMISCGAGFAIAGKLPVIIGNTEFLLIRAFDQIYNDICIPNLNVKIIEVGRSTFLDEKKSLLSSAPNLKIKKSTDLEEAIKEYGPIYMHIDEF